MARMNEFNPEHDRHREMLDNQMVRDDHQEGISRVIQRKGAMEIGQGGKMHQAPDGTREREEHNKMRMKHADHMEKMHGSHKSGRPHMHMKGGLTPRQG